MGGGEDRRGDLVGAFVFETIEPDIVVGAQDLCVDRIGKIFHVKDALGIHGDGSHAVSSSCGSSRMWRSTAGCGVTDMVTGAGSEKGTARSHDVLPTNPCKVAQSFSIVAQTKRPARMLAKIRELVSASFRR
jgi:hypothetical protein